MANPRTDRRRPGAAQSYHVTLEELEREVHVPVDQQVCSQPVERTPATTYEDEVQRQFRLAGGA